MQDHELKNAIRELLAAPGYQPQKPHAIIRSLGVPDSSRRAVRHCLKELAASGELIHLKGNRFAILERGPRFQGRLTMHHHGFGFVLLDPGQAHAPKDDVYVPAGQQGIARHGDTVEIELLPDQARGRRGKQGAEGRVIRVLSRGRNRIVGTVERLGLTWQLIPDDPRFLEVVQIHDPASGVTPEHRNKYVLELNDRGSEEIPESGTLIEKLGPVDDAEVDILSIMRTHGLASEFPDHVEREAAAFGSGIPDQELRARRDLRDWICCTIDPEDARDFDDALTWQALPNGGQRLAVHIADVAYYVRPGTAIDEEAQRRGNSAYLVDRVVSMLPTNLTTDLCSLVPKQDRLAHTAVMDFDENLAVVNCEVFHSVIHSNARLTYQEAQDWMDRGEQGGVPDNLVESLKGLRRLAAALRKQRSVQDALTFNVPEVRCILDDEGHVTGFEKREGMEAYQLVEECMLVANREVGALLATRFRHAIFRIHEEPDQKNWEKMEQDLRELGLGNRPVTRENLNAIVSEDSPETLRLPVTIAILKNLNRARYSERVGEHFGLAFETYSHFTSPIRRYPDLVAHRLLDALADDGGESPYSPEELREMALHCSSTERNADEAEQATVAVRRLQYYHDRLWNGETGPYAALITGVSPKGLHAELQESQQRGLIPFASMGDDYYEINTAGTCARGRRGQRSFRIGDTLDVVLAQVDVNARLVDFAPAEVLRTRKSGPRRPKRRKGEVSKRNRGR